MTVAVACSVNLLSPARVIPAPAQANAPFKRGAPIHVGDHAGMPTGAFGLPFSPN
jgi:hypothetical protein